MFFNFCRKNCEKPFTERHDCFEKGSSDDTNQYNLFCRKLGFKYFLFNNFSKKKKKKSKITSKNNFFFGGGYDNCSGNGTSDNKSEYNFFYEKWGTE